MSTAQNEKHSMDSENYGQRNLAHKQFNSERKHNIRKQALGEIKNVIHNQASITPFKGFQAAGSSKSLCTDLLKKQAEQLKFQVDCHQKLESSQKFQPIATNKPEELEKRDLPAPRTCNDHCYKSLEEIWSEMNVLSPEILERLVNGDDIEDENKYDMLDHILTPINIEADHDLIFEMPDPYEMEMEMEMEMEHLLAKDYENFDIPLALDWVDDL